MNGGYSIRQPDDKEFAQVKKYIEDFWLDNEKMLREQFRILLHNNNLVAFARMRENADSSELCSVGVVKELRGKGLGTEVVKSLLAEAKRDVHLVTVIPGFFRRIGFKQVSEYPASMQKKLHLCSTHYHVGEEYEVMKWNYLPLVNS